MKVRFIHAADLHLDTPFKGLSDFNPVLAEKLKDATFQAFKNIIDKCIVQRVDFLLIAGDTFDSEERSISAQLRFIVELQRLTSAGVSVFFVCGNHDFLPSWLNTLQLPAGAYRFGPQIECHSFTRDGEIIADIYGISFTGRAVNDNLAIQFERRKDPAPISVALCHATIGPPGPHNNYAPFTMVDIQDKGFDYWALGHIHQQEIINAQYPAVVYPGNPQGRDFGERGSKGCYLVELQSGLPPKLQFQTTDSIRFERVWVDLAGCASINDLPKNILKAFDQQMEGIASYIVTVTLVGKTAIHSELTKAGALEGLREMMNDGKLTDSPFIWIDKISTQTWPDYDLDELAKGNDFIADLLRSTADYRAAPERLNTLFKQIEAEMSTPGIKRELKTSTAAEKQVMLNKAMILLLDQLLKDE